MQSLSGLLAEGTTGESEETAAIAQRRRRPAKGKHARTLGRVRAPVKRQDGQKQSDASRDVIAIHVLPLSLLLPFAGQRQCFDGHVAARRIQCRTLPLARPSVEEIPPQFLFALVI